MANGAGKPKPAFFIAVLVVVAGLIALAVMRCKGKSDDGGGSGSDKGVASGSGGSGGGKNTNVEAPPGGPVAGLTADKYDYEPATTLPPVPGTSSYTALGKPRVVKFAVNVWAGWAPIVWANQGSKAGKIWKDGKGGEFQVELQLADDPVNMGNLVANGAHIGWATVDMLPLIIERLKKDPRTMPRVYQQIDWSNGGDGIVVHNDIKEVSDFRGKQVVLAQNSPSHYFLLSMLENGGVNPSEVKMKFTKDAFQAAQAYNQNPKDFAGVVTWSPDIYTLTDNPKSGNRMLVNTQTANKLIADVWFARADFARDNPEIIEGLVRGILDAADDLKSDQNKAKVGDLLDKFYNLPGGTGLKMLADAHWTNYAENKDFFLVANNPTNFQRTYESAINKYKKIGSLPRDFDTEFDKIMDFSVIKKLGGEQKYADSKNTYEFQFTPKNIKDVAVESTIVTKTVTINFFPNSFDIFKKVPAASGGGDVYYDGKVDYTVEEIAKLAGQFGAARIVISGHTDSSMKGTADPQLVKELSENRAKAVKDGLLKKFPKLDPNQVTTTGYGWEKPADPQDPDNHSKNRRVEIKVVPAEAQ